MPSELTIPPVIETVIQEFECTVSPFTELDVQQALSVARGNAENLTDAQKFGAWSEVLAFTLIGNRTNASPWGTFFAPMTLGTMENGDPVYSPDIADADAQVIAHWVNRAKTIQNPVLKARYADLVWEMCIKIADEKRDPEMARLAIDAYLASSSAEFLPRIRDMLCAALRALDLARLIHDQDRTERARIVLMKLHREVIEKKENHWWVTFDRLIQEKYAGVTDAERSELVESLEILILHYAQIDKPDCFNPHDLKNAAERLIPHYRRHKQFDDVRRLNEAIARAFEHFAGLGNAMLASSVLQTSANAYRDAGLTEESKRIRIELEEKIIQARETMKPIESKIQISREDMDRFLKSVVVDDWETTFARIANEFLPNKRSIEDQLQKSLEEFPLSALMPMDLMADDHVAAKVGSVEDDPEGRLIQQTDINFQITNIWLFRALEKTIEVHEVVPEHFSCWANRLNVFEDVTFITEGVEAWYQGDLIKAVHVLVPQVEYGLRNIAGQLGEPVTKGRSNNANTGVAISMGDILYSKKISEALGPDLTLFFLALYADPRGLNLRNRVAHGLIKPKAVSESIVQWLIYTLLVFGVWKEISENLR
jgi:hypothetical protein